MGIRLGVGRSRLRQALELAAAVALAGLATVLASIPAFKSAGSTTDAVMIYLLSVVAATLVARLPGGLVASVLSFLGLNFFFTPPLRTFAVAKSEDLLALIVFLVVAVLIATLLTNTVAQRSRAERSAREAQLLYRISSRLLGGAPLATALDLFVRDMVELFSLAGCEVVTEGLGDLQPGGELRAVAGAPPGPTAGTSLELRTDRGLFGHIRVAPGATGLGEPELGLARAFAGQVALAVEATVLAERTRRSQADAEASRVRAALFSSVTHDLRTPLAAIKASATSLLDAGVHFDSVQRADLLATIAEESDRLNRLIANILSLSRLRAGALVLEKTAAPVEDVIEAAVARLRRRWKDLAIQVRAGDSIPPVPMDLLQIDQVVSNLVENAVHYAGAAQPVEVGVTATPGWVEVRVADHGPGIPAADRERVFEEFYRRDTARGQGGVGLGLAISRAIVEAHGGSMWAGETPGGGATVGFRLPVASAPPPAEAPSPRVRVAE
ncbi:MAG TPA: ATP-binding protein [Actinomycetota bacterium]|nr:ATP-binding protein [Actinomycetota bacterium]